jgi:hypothetical protein
MEAPLGRVGLSFAPKKAARCCLRGGCPSLSRFLRRLGMFEDVQQSQRPHDRPQHSLRMPRGLKRYQETRQLHFITFIARCPRFASALWTLSWVGQVPESPRGIGPWNPTFRRARNVGHPAEREADSSAFPAPGIGITTGGVLQKVRAHPQPPQKMRKAGVSLTELCGVSRRRRRGRVAAVVASVTGLLRRRRSWGWRRCSRRSGLRDRRRGIRVPGGRPRRRRCRSCRRD